MIVLIPLTLTGIIDLFPIINDRRITIDDIPRNETTQYILENTPEDAVFLNAQFLFDPASLAGRKIYLGWPYFSWSAGYDTTSRFTTMKTILDAYDKQGTCELLQKENIDYIEIKDPTDIEEAKINYLFFNENFNKIHFNYENGISVYDVSTSCVSTME